MFNAFSRHQSTKLAAPTFSSRQQGAALIIALILLLAITMLGVSSLRSGIFHERMSMNSQADALTFMGAESAINAVYSMAADSGSATSKKLLADAIVSGQSQQHCVTKTGVQDNVCSTDAQALDTRSEGVLLAETATKFVKQSRVLNTDQSYMSMYQFTTDGLAYFDQSLDLPFANKNVQQWQKLGVSNGFSVSNQDLLN